MEYRFDVYGRMTLVIVRVHGGWEVREVGADGKRMLSDCVIPPTIAPEQLAVFLEELFHEMATPQQPQVRRLE